MKMKIWSVAVVVGVIIFILGVIFHFQGKSIVGPESSFMYSNPEWISYGIQIAVLGLTISGVGIGIKFIKRG